MQSFTLFILAAHFRTWGLAPGPNSHGKAELNFQWDLHKVFALTSKLQVQSNR